MTTARAREGYEVRCNVYDLHDANETLSAWGLGMYHSGLQVGGQEWTYSNSGVFSHSPGEAPGAKMREGVLLGAFQGTQMEMDRVLDDLRGGDFAPGTYNVLTRNCNAFSDALARRLLGVGIPAYVNRMAQIGSLFSCLLPPEMTGQAPVDNGAANGGGGSGSGSGFQVIVPASRRNNTSTAAAAAPAMARNGGHAGGAGVGRTLGSESGTVRHRENAGGSANDSAGAISVEEKRRAAAAAAEARLRASANSS